MSDAGNKLSGSNLRSGGHPLHVLRNRNIQATVFYLYTHSLSLSPMPRIPSPVLLNAYRENQLLPLLLRECRSLDLARNELRWLRGKALSSLNPSSAERCDTPRSGHTAGWRSRLRSMCRVRSQGMPLQYILGDQPFGELEILCRKGVLIPRSSAFSPLLAPLPKVKAKSPGIGVLKE